MAGPDLTPEQLVALLLGATGIDDPHIDREVARIRSRLLGLARANFRSLGDEVEDLVQSAVAEICRPERLRSLRDPSRFWAFAIQILVNKGRDALDVAKRRGGRMADPPVRDDGERLDRDEWLDRIAPSWTNDPAILAEKREVLTLVRDEIRRHPVGWMRIIEDLSEEETRQALGLETRDMVAQSLKRLRAKLRRMLEKASGSGGGGRKGGDT